MIYFFKIRNSHLIFISFIGISSIDFQCFAIATLTIIVMQKNRSLGRKIAYALISGSMCLTSLSAYTRKTKGTASNDSVRSNTPLTELGIISN